MIRITLERDAWRSWDGREVPTKTIVREFESVSEADVWFTDDSYYAESYTRRAVWERIPDGDDAGAAPKTPETQNVHVQTSRCEYDYTGVTSVDAAFGALHLHFADGAMVGHPLAALESWEVLAPEGS